VKIFLGQKQWKIQSYVIVIFVRQGLSYCSMLALLEVSDGRNFGEKAVAECKMHFR
jgi:hypothetical protein